MSHYCDLMMASLWRHLEHLELGGAKKLLHYGQGGRALDVW